MCPHLILTRQYRESCEFLRGGTQAVETANVFYPTKTYGTIGQIYPFRRECCLLGGAHTQKDCHRSLEPASSPSPSKYSHLTS